MKLFQKYQGQHRISQVYLKQFGYAKNEQWYISVWDKSKKYTDFVLVENFSKETNIFDLPVYDEKQIRYFENASSLIESEYTKVVNTIRRQQQLIPKHHDLLCHFMSMLLSKSRKNSELLIEFLNSTNSRKPFLQIITKFDDAEYQKLCSSLGLLQKEYHLNYVLGHVVNHLVYMLRQFHFVILESYMNRGWFTSDNPVIIDYEDGYNSTIEDYLMFITYQCEIYFPLSSRYCLFAYHPNSIHQSNKQRNYKPNRIYKTDEILHKEICDKIVFNESEYFILNQEIEPIKLDERPTSKL